MTYPFDIIEEPIRYKGGHISNGYQFSLSGKTELNNIAIGSSPLFVTTKDHNFINDPVLIYTFCINSNNELSLESEAISSSLWIQETNQPSTTGFMWPNIDGYMMLGFQAEFILVMETLTNSKIVDPVMNIRLMTF